MTERSEPRFLMWVDAVGGYLVCLGNEALIGQAIPDSNADIPIFGDLSRKHATLRRQGEVYVLVPHADTWVDEKSISDPTTLSDGDELRFGKSVVMRFRQPHALSFTCRLEFVSHHRTEPFSDGIIVMANSCILGPNPSNHVVCRNWQNDLVLVRQGQSLKCQSVNELDIDGTVAHGRTAIGLNSRISGSDFCISLEEID